MQVLLEVVFIGSLFRVGAHSACVNGNCPEAGHETSLLQVNTVVRNRANRSEELRSQCGKMKCNTHHCAKYIKQLNVIKAPGPKVKGILSSENCHGDPDENQEAKHPVLGNMCTELYSGMKSQSLEHIFQKPESIWFGTRCERLSNNRDNHMFWGKSISEEEVCKSCECSVPTDPFMTPSFVLQWQKWESYVTKYSMDKDARRMDTKKKSITFSDSVAEGGMDINDKKTKIRAIISWLKLPQDPAHPSWQVLYKKVLPNLKKKYPNWPHNAVGIKVQNKIEGEIQDKFLSAENNYVAFKSYFENRVC